jgi:ABC-type phosphate transport system auxiliary subunit
MIHEEIRSLLDAPPTGDDAPSLDDIEHTLTSGYASALALEAERLRLERRISAVAAKLDEDASDLRHSELKKLGQRLSAADVDLNRLRALLSSLRSRAEEVRTTTAA